MVRARRQERNLCSDMVRRRGEGVGVSFSESVWKMVST